VPSKAQIISKTIGYPSEWGVVRADKICSIITKGTTPHKSEIGSNRKIPFLRVNDLTFEGKLKEKNETQFISDQTHRGFLARSIAYPDDILMNIVGPPLGKFAFFAQHISRIQPKPSNSNIPR